MRRWCSENPEKAKAAEAQWRKANPERKAALQREYAQRHPERVLANLKRWQEENPDKYRDQVLIKRARRRGARTGEKVILDDIIQHDRGRCGICGDPIIGQLHLDHVVPIAAGGSHEPDNVQLAHPDCNARKWAKLDYVPPEAPRGG
jgi:5-methylcytosine-specific restriction endonuclease McrA